MSSWAILAVVILCTTVFRPAGFDNPAPTKPSTSLSQGTFGFTTAVHSDLVSLPPPKQKPVVAVYSFKDQTGQYKYSSKVATYSKAVTQGATSMLIKALEDSGWFIPIEREGLAHLAKEREIINLSREKLKSQGKSYPPLPVLMYAGIILEGGIISYDANLVTGGFGAKYFGLGGDVQYRRDQVSIFLRAVSTKTGRIIKSVSTTKSILSKEVHLGLFRLVSLRRLLEVETGLTTNEPPQMCVLEAIEEAVLALVIEGILDETWALNDPEDIESPVIRRYLLEKKGQWKSPSIGGQKAD